MRSLFIGAMLVFQLGLPLRYYLSDDTFDERFAWRMFSPIRVVRCEVRWTEGAARRPIKVGRDVHHVWYSLMKRARIGVVDAFAKRRCDALLEGGESSPEVYARITCRHPDGPINPIDPETNRCLP